MCRTDATGGIQWSTQIQPAAKSYTSYSGAEIAKVYERFNTNTNQYEYFGVAGSYVMPNLSLDRNLVVFKLNENGNTTGISPSEFHYPAAWGPLNTPKGHCDLTGIETGGGPNDGFQAFGTGLSSTQHVFIKSYFNGVSGCQESLTDIDSLATGPQLIGNLSFVQATLPPCQTQLIVSTPSQPGGTPCVASSVPGDILFGSFQILFRI
jgi:hypothetical protein